MRWRTGSVVMGCMGITAGVDTATFTAPWLEVSELSNFLTFTIRTSKSGTNTITNAWSIRPIQVQADYRFAIIELMGSSCSSFDQS